MPLILKGHKKKVITLSTGLADMEITRKFDLDQSVPYSISKAALNMAVAKFSAQYAKDGVLFLSLSPGLVDTGLYADGESHGALYKDGESDRCTATEEQTKKLMAVAGKFKAYAPHFTGAITPEASVRAMMPVIEQVSVAGGDGGAFISHLGNKQWL